MHHMSGVEPFLASMLAAAGEAAAAVGSTIASAATSAGSAVGIGSSAAEFASIAGGTAEALSGAASVGLTTGEVISGVSALSTAAGAGSQLLAGKPKAAPLPQQASRDEAQREADMRSEIYRRRGRAAALLTPGGAKGDTSQAPLGAASLLGG